MADKDPPLFDNVDINSAAGVDDDGDDLFVSTLDVCEVK